MPPPSFGQHLGFDEAVEDLAVEQFVAKRPVEPQAGPWNAPTTSAHAAMIQIDRKGL